MGRIIVEPDTPAARAAVATAFRYLWRSGTARRVLRRYRREGGWITVSTDVASASAENATGHILWSPTQGSRLPSGAVNSPALALLHEIVHATHFYHRPDRDAEDRRISRLYQAAMAVLGPAMLAMTGGKWTPEEERATRVEDQVARELGETPRRRYVLAVAADGVAGPTAHSAKG